LSEHENSNEISGEECFYIMKEFSWGLRNCRYWQRYFYNTKINIKIPVERTSNRFTLELEGIKVLGERRFKTWGEIRLNSNLRFSRLPGDYFSKIRMIDTNLILKENYLDHDFNAFKKLHFGYNSWVYRNPIHRFHNRCSFVPKLDGFAACVAVTMVRELLPYAGKMAQRKEKILDEKGRINYPESRNGWWDRKTCHDFRGKHLPTSSVLINGTEFEINEDKIKINTI